MIGGAFKLTQQQIEDMNRQELMANCSRTLNEMYGISTN